MLSRAIDLRQQEPQTDADMIETTRVAAVTTRSQNRITNLKSPVCHRTNTPDNRHIKAKSLIRPQLPQHQPIRPQPTMKHPIPKSDRASTHTTDQQMQQNTTSTHTTVDHQQDTSSTSRPQPDASQDNTETQPDDDQLPLDLETIKIEQRKDPYYNYLIEYLTTETEPHDRNILRKVLRHKNNHVMKDEILFYIHKPKVHKHFEQDWEFHVCLPIAMRTAILKLVHDSPYGGLHYSSAKTLQKLSTHRVHWNSQNQDVIQYVNECKNCLEFKRSQLPNPPLQNYDPSRGLPFTTVFLDSYGPLPTTKNGFKHIMGCLCRFSHYLILIPLQTNSSAEIALALFHKVYLKHGNIKQIHTDNAKGYASSIMKAMTQLLKTVHSKNSPLHAASNLVERKWQQVTSSIATFLQNHSDWELFLPYLKYTYNTTPSDGLGGLAPAEIVFAHPPRPILADSLQLPDQMLPTVQEFVNMTKDCITKVDKFVREVLLENHIKNTNQKNKTAKLTEYHIGQRVALYCPTIPNKDRKKQCPKFYRPWKTNFRIFEIKDPHTLQTDS